MTTKRNRQKIGVLSLLSLSLLLIGTGCTKKEAATTAPAPQPGATAEKPAVPAEIANEFKNAPH